MVKNKSAKGQRYERKARHILEDEGYLTDFKIRSRYASNDFFEVFDIFAISKKDLKLVQVKTNISDFYKARKEVARWILKHDFEKIGINFEVWLREPRKPWRREIINPQD